MLSPFLNLTNMGVINITPNSFSDQKKFDDPKNLELTINKFLQDPNLIFDFGFESTAPMNESISRKTERERFDYFFESIKNLDLSDRWISFDTYKIENYQYFEEQLKKRYKNCGTIFNDVSGVIDKELIHFLRKKVRDESFYYLHSFTKIPSRLEVNSHMTFVDREDIIQQAKIHFQSAYQEFLEIGFTDKLIFDPGFGFSKSYEQNWQLIVNFAALLNQLKSFNITVPWLVGLSKKSFLRKFLKTDSFEATEELHQQLILDFLRKNQGEKIIFRVHNPEIVKNALECFGVD